MTIVCQELDAFCIVVINGEYIFDFIRTFGAVQPLPAHLKGHFGTSRGMYNGDRAVGYVARAFKEKPPLKVIVEPGPFIREGR
jgi:hypothetical protein